MLPVGNIYTALRSESSSVASDPIEELEDEEWNFDDMEDVEIDAIFDIIKDVETTVGEAGFFDEIEGDMAALFDVLGHEQKDDIHRPDFVPSVTPPSDLFAVRKTRNFYHKHGLRWAPGAHIVTVGSKLYALINGNRTQVGVSKGPVLNLELDEKIPSVLASAINESGDQKGTGLGYSSFIHSCGICIIAKPGGLIEPMEGFDYLHNGSRHEMTGLNFDKRRTQADFVWNKYAICELYFDLDHDLEDLVKFSLHEDSGYAKHFNNGAFDQPQSPYTGYFDRLHDLTSDLSDRSLPALAAMVENWVTSRPANYDRDPVTIPDPSIIEDAIKRGAKTYPDFRVPAPFRVLAGPSNAAFNMQEYQIEVSLGIWDPPTHFHTQTIDEDPTPVLLSKPTFQVDNPMNDHGISSKIIFGQCLRFSVFQSIYVESELLSKIQFRNGCFWSKYSNAGIAWKMVRSNSLTYYCCYYSLHDPGSSCGIWRLHDEENSVWVSPTFKVSLSDVSFAKVLPFRIFATTMSVMAYCKKGERGYVLRQIMRASATSRWSTWQTSALAGDFRFFSLCAVSGSGDLAKMSAAACSKVNKPITFPDYYVLRLLLEFAKAPERIGNGKTPLFDMPIRFLAIEKDLALTHSWHIRKADHATECFKKLAQGIRDEAAWRPLLLDAYKRQVEFFEKAYNLGVSQEEFNELMRMMPGIPYYNHILFLAFAYISSAKLDAGRRQESTGINLAKVVSDHHCIYIEKHHKLERVKIKSPRVADGINSVLKEYGQPEGIHMLLSRMNKGTKVNNIYTIHPKDSKSKNREIPQMTTHMRIPQFVSETLLTIYTDAEETDMMQNPDKYAEFVKQFSNIMRRGGLSRSEDKSFFCGHMHPEAMSLAILSVSKVLGSPSLVTSSAILRCDKSRWTVLPPEADESVAQGINERIRVVIPSGKKLHDVLAVKNNIHFMQGVRALGGAVVNTVFSTALDIIQRKRCPDIELTAVMTTSDDSARAVVAKRNAMYSSSTIHADYINLPISLVGHCMMKDSSDKPILSNRIAEFNNVAAGPNGMIPQTFVHAHLALQPLNADTFVDDLISTFSNARMSLTWGDSIDLVRSVYDSNLVYLCQRWLLTQRELDGLFDSGIIPQTDEDLISGKFCFTKEAKLKLISTLREEVKKDILAGELNILDGLRSYRLKKTGKSPKPQLVLYDGPIERLKIAFSQINAARRVRGRKKALLTRPVHFTDRVAAKNAFVRVMLGPTPTETPEMAELLALLPDAPSVYITHTKPRFSDMNPTVIGQIVEDPNEVTFKNVFTKRVTGVDFSTRLRPYEEFLVGADFDTVKKAFNLQSTKKTVSGVKYKSPGGRPQTRFYNGKVLNQPYTFSFNIDLDQRGIPSSNYTQGGIRFDTFTPCFYGNYTLTQAKTQNCKLAYGYAIMGSEVVVFYQLLNRPVSMYKTNYTKQNIVVVSTSRDKIICPIRKDLTPIRLSTYEVTYDQGYNHNFGGDPDAVQNYGNYLNTRSRSAIKSLRAVFAKFGSDFPGSIIKFKPSYPWYPESATKLPTAKVNKFIGSKSICKLELSFMENPTYSQTYDLNGQVPRIIIETLDDDEAQWE